jgi:hypothetical protein
MQAISSHPENALDQSRWRVEADAIGASSRDLWCTAAPAFGPEATLEVRSADHHIAGMGSSSKDVPTPSTEEATLLRLLAKLEKAARASGARCTPEATAGICERLRKLAAELSSESGPVWHP